MKSPCHSTRQDGEKRALDEKLHLQFNIQYNSSKVFRTQNSEWRGCGFMYTMKPHPVRISRKEEEDIPDGKLNLQFDTTKWNHSGPKIGIWTRLTFPQTPWYLKGGRAPALRMRLRAIEYGRLRLLRTKKFEYWASLYQGDENCFRRGGDPP